MKFSKTNSMGSEVFLSVPVAFGGKEPAAEQASLFDDSAVKGIKHKAVYVHFKGEKTPVIQRRPRETDTGGLLHVPSD